MFWIKIDNANKNLETYPGTVFSYNIVNPAFDPLQTENSYSYSFKIPMSPVNMEALAWTGRLDKIKTDEINRIWPATLYVEGTPLEYGHIVIKSHSERDIEIEFIVPGREIMDKLAEKSMHSIREYVRLDSSVLAVPEVTDINELQGVVLMIASIPPGWGASDLYLEVTIGGVNFRTIDFPQSYWGGLSGDVIMISLVDIINDFFGDTVAYFIGTPPNRSIVIRDWKVEIGEVTSNGLFSILNLNKTIANVQFIWARNARLINEDDAKNFVWPLISAEEAQATDPWADKWYNKRYGDEYYAVWGTRYQDDTSGTPNPFNWTNLPVPMVKCRWLLQQIFASVDIMNILGEVINNQDIHESILFSNVAMLKRVEGNLDYFFADEPKPGLAIDLPLLEFDLAAALPKTNCKDFFITFCKFFGLYWGYLGDNTIEFKSKIAQIKDTQEDWTSKCEPGWERELTAEFFKLKYPENPGIKIVTGQLQPMGDGDKEIKLPAGTLPYTIDTIRGEKYDNISPYIFLDPATHEIKAPLWSGGFSVQGFAPLHGDVLPEFVGSDTGGLIFLFWRGEREDDQGEKYGYATHDHIDYEGDVVGSLNLDMHGTESIYFKRWKDIFDIENGDTITLRFRLGLDDILNLRQWERTVKKIYTSMGTILGVVKSAEFQFVSDIWQSEIVAKVEMGMLK